MWQTLNTTVNGKHKVRELLGTLVEGMGGEIKIFYFEEKQSRIGE